MMSSEMSPELRGVIESLYPDEEAHGREHALETERRVEQILNYPEYVGKITTEDANLVKLAALAHDVGYKERHDYWTGWQWEHPYASLEILKSVLGDTLPPEANLILGFLVINHDNTVFSFPAHRRLELFRTGFTEAFGTPGLPPGMFSDYRDYEDYDLDWQRFDTLLHILQEADASLGDSRRTLAFSISRKIPLVADDGGIPGIGMPMWQQSGLANVLLAANRYLLDSYTVEGQKNAWKMFLKARRLIVEGISVHSEAPPGYDNVGVLLRKRDVEEFIWHSLPYDRTRDYVRITQAFPLGEVYRIMPNPWSNIRIPKVESRLIEVDKIELKEDKDEDKLWMGAHIRDSLLKNYAIDILTELSGGLRVFAAPGPMMLAVEYTIIPPVLVATERSDEGIYSPPFVVESGGTWIHLSRERGLKKIRALFIDDKSY